MIKTKIKKLGFDSDQEVQMAETRFKVNELVHTVNTVLTIPLAPQCFCLNKLQLPHPAHNKLSTPESESIMGQHNKDCKLKYCHSEVEQPKPSYPINLDNVYFYPNGAGVCKSCGKEACTTAHELEPKPSCKHKTRFLLNAIDGCKGCAVKTQEAFAPSPKPSCECGRFGDFLEPTCPIHRATPLPKPSECDCGDIYLEAHKGKHHKDCASLDKPSEEECNCDCHAFVDIDNEVPRGHCEECKPDKPSEEWVCIRRKK